MPRYPRSRSTGSPAALTAIWALIGGSSFGEAAELDIRTSASQVCTPLNVTWTPEQDAYPYTVWISGIRGSADSFQIPSDYQPNESELTFQYVVPPPAIGFQSYIVALADSKGNGNSSRPLGISMPNGANTGPCNPFTSSPAWLWAGDPQNSRATMEQCGTVRFYNIDQRGTAPFSITWIPIGGNPITVNIPRRATLNTSSFIYETVVPFAADTQFQVILGDALGGASGGGSELYTTAASTKSDCIQAGYRLAGRNTSYAMPPATNPQMFRDLSGAINETGYTPKTDSGGGSNVGAIAGGAIGGAIAVAIVIGLLIAFLLFKRRQKKQKEEARKEDVHFVDLDGDEDEGGGGGGSHSLGAVAAARRRSRIASHRGPGVQQSYSVSPFTYQTTSSPEDFQPGQHEMTSRASRNNSFGGSAAGGGGAYPHSPSPSHAQEQDGAGAGQYGDLLAAAGMARAPSSNNSTGHRPTSSHSFGSNHGLLASPATSPLTNPQPAFAYGDRHRSDSHGSAGGAAMGSYRLRTTNDDIPPSHADQYPSLGGGAKSTSGAGPLPRKTPLPGDEEESSHAAAASAAATRRVVMHSDGGPLPQPESDGEGALEELPPQYGGWTSPPAGATAPSDRPEP